LLRKSKKGKRVIFDRPKPTAGCSANGEEEEEEDVTIVNLWGPTE
jgi:hypothetical protein